MSWRKAGRWRRFCGTRTEQIGFGVEDAFLNPTLLDYLISRMYVYSTYNFLLCTEIIRTFVIKMFNMEIKDLNTKDARFDTRLSKAQKDFFEKAAHLGGFRNLTDFVIMAVNEKAKEIIAEREQILASQRDNEIFFDALLNPGAPNKALQKAADEFNAMLP